jgi:hypothetical protein
MVGYDPNQINLNAKDRIYVSIASSVLSRFIVQPFDVLKIRFQVEMRERERVREREIEKKRFLSQFST